MAQRRPLEGSDFTPHADPSRVDGIAPDLPITVSVYLKNRVPHRQRVSHEDLAAVRAEHHADDLARIVAFAEMHGLTVDSTHPERRMVRLTGPAKALEAAFETRLGLYEHEDGRFRGRRGPLTLPEELHDSVLAVLGLEDHTVAHRHAADADTVSARQPSEIARLYGFPEAYTGKGQTVAILEFGGGYRPSDIAASAKAQGVAVPPITDVGLDGHTNTPGGQSDVEVALDIEVLMGAAPGATLVIYFCSCSEQGVVDCTAAAAHDARHKASVISLSWGSPEKNWSAAGRIAMDNALQDAARLGVTVVSSSGDRLAGAGLRNGTVNVDFPSSSPNCMACGGTRISIRDDAVSAEVVWNAKGEGSGGGVSVYFAQSQYQANAGAPVSLDTGKPGRAVPDIAANADPASGYIITVAGQTWPLGGTSASAPLWAALITRANQARAEATPPKPALGFFNQQLYASPPGLGTVTEGNNYIPGTEIGYTAGPGYNCCTGLGTPRGGAVLQALVEM